MNAFIFSFVDLWWWYLRRNEWHQCRIRTFLFNFKNKWFLFSGRKYHVVDSTVGKNKTRRVMKEWQKKEFLFSIKFFIYYKQNNTQWLVILLCQIALVAPLASWVSSSQFSKEKYFYLNISSTTILKKILKFTFKEL